MQQEQPLRLPHLGHRRDRTPDVVWFFVPAPYAWLVCAVTGGTCIPEESGNLGPATTAGPASTKSDYTAALASPPSVSPTHAAKRRAAILNDRAVTLVQLGRLDDAVADESEAIRLRPDRGDYFANRARMFQRMGRTDDADSDWQRARTLHASEGSTSPP